MMTDPVADLLNRIKTAYAVGKEEIRLPSSRFKRELAQALLERGYLESETLEELPRPTLVIRLRYQDGAPAVQSLRRLSRPGHRRYVGHAEIPRIRGGFGEVILSTPQGVLTGQAARSAGVGGELLCEVF